MRSIVVKYVDIHSGFLFSASYQSLALLYWWVTLSPITVWMKISIFVYSFSLIDLISFRAPAHSNRDDLDVDGSIISHIRIVWSIYSNHFSFQDRVSWTLLSANMDRPAIEDVWPSCPWLSWSPMFPPIIEVRLSYSWIDGFARSSTFGSI